MKKIKEYLARDISMVILFTFFLVICVVMLASFGTSMFNGTTLASMAFQLSEVAVLAFGMALCMLLGGIDLSIVANANLTSLLAAMVLTGAWFDVEKAGTTVTIVVAVVVAVGVGALCGLLNGIIISKFSTSATTIYHVPYFYCIKITNNSNYLTIHISPINKFLLVHYTLFLQVRQQL